MCGARQHMGEPYPSRRTERALTPVMSHHADDNAVNRSIVFDAVAAHGLNLYYIRVNTLGTSLICGLRALTSTAALMQPDDCWPTPTESRESQDTARTLSALRTGPVPPTELTRGSEKWLSCAHLGHAHLRSTCQQVGWFDRAPWLGL